MSMRFACLLLVSASVAFTAPVLRLSQTVVTPRANVIQAYNAGDGTLSPGVSVASGVPWLTPSVGGPCPAGSPQSCVLIQFNFNTASLAQGIYTASVTVFAPGAVYSPQIVIAMAQLGGSPVIVVDSYLTPGATCDVPFTPVCNAFGIGDSLTVSTQDGGTWLSVVRHFFGTLECISESDLIHVAPPPTMAPGTYAGSVTSAATGRAPQTVSVTMRLAALPLAVPSPSSIDLTLAQGGPPLTFPFVPAISLNPQGMVSATSAAASGAGFSASVLQGNVTVMADPNSLAPGTYNGSVTVGCAAVNCPVVVPVTLTVAAPGPPVLNGVFDNVTFGDGPVAPGEVISGVSNYVYGVTGFVGDGRVAPGEVMVVRGEQLSMAAPAYANGAPLPTTLGGASVLVNGVAAPLYYSSPNQIAFQLPANTLTATLSNLVQVQRGGQTSNGLGPAEVWSSAPEIAAITDPAYNVLDAFHPAHVGGPIILWVIGLGVTAPSVPDGAAGPSNPLAIATIVPTVQFGSSVTANPSFAGLSPGTVGLYQVNVTVPASTPSGKLSVKLIFPSVSNAVPLTIQ